MEVIIKEDYQISNNYQSDSLFISTLTEFISKYKKKFDDIILIKYINYNKEIKVEQLFNIGIPQNNELATLDVVDCKQNPREMIVKDIPSFQVFSSTTQKHLRVRKDNDNGHQSDALIKCGIDDTTYTTTMDLFRNLNTHCSTASKV